MKKVLGCGGIAAVAILFVMIIAAVGSNSRSSHNEFDPAKPKAEVKRELTMEKYNEIQSGMTPEQVAEILGTPGSEQASSSIDMGAAGKTESVIRTYRSEGFSMGNITVTYSNGKVLSKAQFGL